MTTDDIELAGAEEIVPVVPREARTFQGHRAGVVTRVTAATVDMAVVLLVVAAGYGAVAVGKFLLSPRNFTFPKVSSVVSLSAVLGVLVVYLTVSWSVTGRTYGNRVMGLRVVRLPGDRVGPVRAFLRAAFYTLFPIGLFLCAARRDSRSVQDLALRTAVVYDWHLRAPWRGDAV